MSYPCSEFHGDYSGRNLCETLSGGRMDEHLILFIAPYIFTAHDQLLEKNDLLFIFVFVFFFIIMKAKKKCPLENGKQKI